MTRVLRILLILFALLAFFMVIKKIKKSQLKVSESIIWIVGCIILIILSIFPEIVVKLSEDFGFYAPVNFVFFVMFIFLLIQDFIYNIKISKLNEKVKELDHYIALKEYEKGDEKVGKSK